MPHSSTPAVCPLTLLALLLRHGPSCPISEHVEDPDKPQKETIGGRKASWQRDHLFCHSGERPNSDCAFLSLGSWEIMSGAKRNGAARGLWEAEAMATRRVAARGRGLCGRNADALHDSAARKVRSSHRAAFEPIMVYVRRLRCVPSHKKNRGQFPKIPPKINIWHF